MQSSRRPGHATSTDKEPVRQEASRNKGNGQLKETHHTSIICDTQLMSVAANWQTLEQHLHYHGCLSPVQNRVRYRGRDAREQSWTWMHREGYPPCTTYFIQTKHGINPLLCSVPYVQLQQGDYANLGIPVGRCQVPGPKHIALPSPLRCGPAVGAQAVSAVGVGEMGGCMSE